MKPIMASAWPPMYLEPECTTTSTPSCSGRQKTGVAQVPSRIEIAPPSRATRAMAGISGTSKVPEPGASNITALVSGRISAARPSPIMGSKYSTSAP